MKLKLMFLVAFLLTGMYKIEWSSIGDDTSMLSSEETRRIEIAVCELASAEREWIDAQDEEYPYTFERYYEFLLRVDSVNPSGYRGSLFGDICAQDVGQQALHRLYWLKRTGQDTILEEELRQREISHEQYMERSSYWKQEGERSKKFREETVPALKSWSVTTYLLWLVLSFFYFLLFWREKDENIACFGWFAALIYALFFPIVWVMYVKREGRAFARWIWFEAKVRQAQEEIFSPLSLEVRKQARAFARSTRSLREQDELFRKEGIITRHRFASALLVTIVLLPVQAGVSQDMEDDTQVVVHIDDSHPNLESTVDNASPPELSFGLDYIQHVLLAPFYKVVAYVEHYIFFMPEPSVQKIRKVPKAELDLVT